jgi:predicted nucleotidyltransferase
MGRPRAAALVPLLRSDAMARVLASIYLAPSGLHVRGIADRTQLPYSVVQREVDRLEAARAVRSASFAASRIVRPDESHPYYRELYALLLKAYGPREVLAELLVDEPGIREAFIHGSWAARYLGEAGPAPEDVDVIVIGDPEAGRLEELEAEAEDTLGLHVQLTALPESEWTSPSHGFTRNVRERPLVRIVGLSNDS